MDFIVYDARATHFPYGKKIVAQLQAILNNKCQVANRNKH